VVLVDGTEADVDALRERVQTVLAPMGLTLSSDKTHIAHMSQGFDFLGFRIQWRRKKGTQKWYVYTFVADRPFRSVKTKIRALTPRTSQQDLEVTLIRINQILRGWTNYFQHAIAKRTFGHLHQYTWWRIVRWQRTRHRWNWHDIRRWLTTPTGRWEPITAGETVLFNASAVPIRRYRYRGQAAIPNPWAGAASNHA
jgi:RNA-directed DNA polymerase